MKVAIIGGGITGLTTAVAFEKFGIPYALFERASDLQPVGAGILMSPNAMSVFKSLGIDDQVKEAGVPLRNMYLTDRHLVPLAKSDDAEYRQEKGWEMVAIHRGQLQQVLLNNVDKSKVHLGQELIDFDQKAVQVNLRFTSMETSAEIVLAADGIHSKSRLIMFNESNLRDSNQICWRGVADIALPASHQNICMESWGKGVRLGFTHINASQVYWFAVAKKDLDAGNAEELKHHLMAMYSEFDPMVANIIKHTSADSIFKSPLLDLQRLDSWAKGRVLLLGDAAHATTPNMGQGAAQGIEDAYFISKLIKDNHNYKELFKAFETKRRKKVDHIVNNSWRFGKLAHSIFGTSLAKAIFSLTPKQKMLHQLAYVYELQD